MSGDMPEAGHEAVRSKDCRGTIGSSQTIARHEHVEVLWRWVLGPRSRRAPLFAPEGSAIRPLLPAHSADRVLEMTLLAYAVHLRII